MSASTSDSKMLVTEFGFTNPYQHLRKDSQTVKIVYQRIPIWIEKKRKNKKTQINRHNT